MSIKVMAQVWEYKWDQTQHLILLALADWADDRGGHIYPSVARVAWKTQVSERTVQRAFADLKKMGVMIVVRKAHAQRPTEYRLDLTRGVRLSPFRGDTETGDTSAEVTGDVETSDTGDTGEVTSVTPNTSYNHQNETPVIELKLENGSKKAVSDSPHTSTKRVLPPLNTAIAEECYAPGYLLTDGDWARVSQAAQVLTAKNATPEQVRERVAIYKGWGNYSLSPQAIARHWDRLGEEPVSFAKKKEVLREDNNRNVFANFLAAGGD